MLSSRCGIRAFAVCLLYGSSLMAQEATRQPPDTEATLRQFPTAPQQTSSLASRHSAQERQKADAALSSGTLQTLPHWQRSYFIGNKRYHYTIVGGNPEAGGTTEIKTLIVPIRLTISDFSENGKTPLVLDATKVTGQILRSPIFKSSDYITGFQQFGDATEARVVQQKTKRVDADLALADVLMPVDARSERFLRIVEMKRANVLDPDVRRERINGPLVVVAVAELVSRGEDVARIETDADALLVVDERDDAAQLFERAAET